MEEVRSYRTFSNSMSMLDRMRARVRRGALAGLSLTSRISGGDWIRFPYYHHVFDDERVAFERQLRYLRSFGEFISMDDAVRMLTAATPIDGRYFCVSFDDGFANCRSNMLPITAALDVPVIIYLPTSYTGLDARRPEEAERILGFYPEAPRLVPFLTWAQCREMMAAGVAFGSHTHTHANLMRITRAAITEELRGSKQLIEDQLHTECRHFACPWGRPGADFDAHVAPLVARELGYNSFATTARGAMRAGDDPFMLRRDHLIAGWDNFQLRYFFGR